MEDAQKIELFERMPIAKAVLNLSIPTVISSLVMVLYNLADTYFVGMLNDPIQNAAVTLAAPVLLAFNAVNNLFGVGSSSMMSRALGRKDYDSVKRSSAIGFYSVLICGLLFSLLCISFRAPLLNILGTDGTTRVATEGYMLWTVYLGAAPAILNVVMAYLVRAEGASLHASLGTMSGCLLNIILDPIFILPWGLNMGAAGAGLATFISNCVSCLYFFVLLWVKRGRTYVCVNPKMFRFKKEIILGVCAVGIPASIQNLLNVTSMTVLNNFTAGFGSDAVAAMGIAQKLNMIPMQIAIGFSQGMMPLVGYNYAYGNVKRMKNGVLFTAKCMMSFLVVFALVYYFGAGSLVAAFMKNETIVGYGSRFLRVFCLQMPFLCMDFLGVGIYQACGMGKKSLAFAIARKIILEIPLLFIMNEVYPLYGLPYSHLITEVILAVAAVFVLRGIFKKLEARER